MRWARHEDEAPAQVVTTVRESLEDEQNARIKRYLITMSIRTVSFVLAVLTHGPLRWTFVALAVFLPYFAVVAANAVRPRALGAMRRNSTDPGTRELPMSEPLTCSAKACRETATTALLWNNPRLHAADRRKVWLACDTHAVTLGEFLSLRGFLRDRVPVDQIPAGAG